MNAGAVFRCARIDCAATYTHPSIGCETGPQHKRCAHLFAAGWRPVLLRVELDMPGVHRVLVLSQAAWLCPADVVRYVPATQRRLF